MIGTWNSMSAKRSCRSMRLVVACVIASATLVAATPLGSAFAATPLGSAFAGQSKGPTQTTAFSGTVDLACNFPIVGAMTIPMTISGQAPASLTLGQIGSLTGLNISIGLPAMAILASNVVHSPFYAYGEVEHLNMSLGGANPSSIDLLSPPNGPLTSSTLEYTGFASFNLPTIAQSSSFSPVNGISEISISISSAVIDFAITDQGTTPTPQDPIGASACTAASGLPLVAIPVSAPSTLPSVTSVSPGGGPAGGATLVEVSGTGFTGATSVSFGSESTPFFYVVSDNLLYVYAPPGSGGAVGVSVTAPGGTSPAVPSDQYVYAAAAAPSVSAVYPPRGPAAGGTIVALVGSGFTGATSVSFGSSPTPFFSVLSDNVIFVYSTPSQAGLKVDVTVTTPIGSSAKVAQDQFTYDA